MCVCVVSVLVSKHKHSLAATTTSPTATAAAVDGGWSCRLSQAGGDIAHKTRRVGGEERFLLTPHSSLLQAPCPGATAALHDTPAFVLRMLENSVSAANAGGKGEGKCSMRCRREAAVPTLDCRTCPTLMLPGCTCGGDVLSSLV